LIVDIGAYNSDCLATYNFNNFSAVIRTLNRQEMDNIYSILLPAPTQTVQPTIRLHLNAGYYLDVSTPLWQANRAKFPNLSAQYQQLVDLVVSDATSRGVVVIIDLHWSDDVSTFSPMALKGTATSGDAVTFWNQVATKYASNPLVFYELFNAPHIDSYTTWMEGDAQFEGMRKMTAAVLTKNVKGMLLIGGQRSFAYDAASLLKYTTDINNKDKALFVFQPYMGPIQASEVIKGVPGFIDQVDQVLTATKRPIVLSSLGQFCCPAEGPCGVHDGTHLNGKTGYIRAILLEATRRNISWTGFGYRPGTGGRCDQPDINDGAALYASASHDGLGANWAELFPTFYSADSNNLPTLPSLTPSVQAATIDIAVPVGAGVGGAIALAGALGLVWRRHKRKAALKQKRIEEELATWTDNEVRALQEKWQVTHDFNELCSVVPHRTRESVAWKAKSFQQKTKSTFIHNFQRTASFVPSERFNFIYPRRPYNLPGPLMRAMNESSNAYSGPNRPPAAGPVSPYSSSRNYPASTSNPPNGYSGNNPNYYNNNNPYYASSTSARNPMYYDSMRTTVSY